MNKISLSNSGTETMLALSSLFVDHYMPSANGEFVKIYLYLLRTLAQPDADLTLSSVADTLSCTEKDVERALYYWEKAGVLTLESEENRICGIILLPLSVGNSAKKSSLKRSDTASAVPSDKLSDAPVRTRMSAAHIQKLKSENEDIAQFLFMADQYIGRPLNPGEISRILYFYEELHFPIDLLEYLIEYCISKGNSSIRYIETVGLSWHKEGIQTVAMARQSTNTWNKNYFAILKAFGIRGRSPVEQETSYMDRWLKEYGFTLDIIQEACSRSVTQTGQASFPYADKILSNWHKKGVRHLPDIAVLDGKHKERQEALASRSKENPGNPDPNKFNRFHQRDYDWNQLEKQLLNQ